MERLGRFFSRIALRLLPDPLVLALMLSLLVALVALLLPPADSLRELRPLARTAALADLWLQGFANPTFLEFALQMSLILLTGYGLAKAPPAERILERLSAAAHTNRGAAALVAFVSALGCWINWGFGLILGGLLAARIRARFERAGIPCQYPLIVACAYVGMMVWHGGLSGSAPLRVSKDGVTLIREEAGTIQETNSGPITIDRTLFAPANLLLSAALIAGLPLAARLMAGDTQRGRVGERERGSSPNSERGTRNAERSADTSLSANPSVLSPESSALPSSLITHHSSLSFAERLNRSQALRLAIVLAALVALAVRIQRRHWAAVDLNFINLLFFTLGLALHRDVFSYITAVAEGGRAIVGIVIQFPLYGGIERIMSASGLVAAISGGFVSAAQWTADALGLSAGVTFPIATFTSAGLVNLFIPSGGGQWIVQGPIMASAAERLGLSLPQTVMAVAYGDQITNMIQPFWAIPLMGLTQVNPREFMGYCALLMLLAAPAFILALAFF